MAKKLPPFIQAAIDKKAGKKPADMKSSKADKAKVPAMKPMRSKKGM